MKDNLKYKKDMEENKYTFPNLLSSMKYILRKTGEEVEVIASQQLEVGARNSDDWVTYIDSKGNEHIKEPLNFQLDFKPANTLSNMFDWAKSNKMPTTRNCRIFEVAKELILHEDLTIKEIVEIATELVDEVGIETV